MNTLETPVPPTHPTVPEPRAAAEDADPSTALRSAREAARLRSQRRRQRRADRAQHRFDRIGRRLRDAHFGHPLVEDLTTLHAGLSQAIGADIIGGATVHRRLPWAVRQVPWVVALLDGVVLLSFCADIFNAALLDPASTPIESLVSLLLAVLGSGIAFTWLAVTGLRLRVFRTALGEVAWAAVGGLTWIMISLGGVLVATLALLMFTRVSTEVMSAVQNVSESSAQLLGLVFAVLSAIANLAVVAVHALDGSAVAADHRHAGRVLRRHERRTNRLRPGGQPQG